MPQLQTSPIRKAFGAQTEPLGERQVRVVITTDQVDRSGDVVVQKGVSVANFNKSRTVLWNHDQDHPVASCVDLAIKADAIEALVQFPDAGISPKADEVYGLVKAGVINAVSIGFLPLDAAPVDGKNPRKGIRINESELLEFSFVAVPANPGAQVLQRAFRGVDRAMTRKSLYAVAELAYVLNMLGYQVDAAFEERLREGDTSGVPEQLKDALAQLGAALIAMTTEEVGELIADRGASAGIPDNDCMILLSAVRGVFKAGAPSLKAGRQFSAENATAMRGHLKAIGDGHQAMVKMLDEAGADAGRSNDDEDLDPDQKALRDQRRRESETLALLHA